jgi:N-ethylmaleimide reductase
MPDLFSPLRIGHLELRNRIIMAPLTRKRALEGNVPGPLNRQYYVQRATAGLLITEATQVSQQGQGYPNTPGIHSREQVASWRSVTSAVHAAGGTIFLQLWHVGRISHRSLQPNNGLPVAPSPIKPGGLALASNASDSFEVPRELSLEELPGVVDDFRQGAKNAMEAGFDGVEVHGANGYLLEQFLNDGTNIRADRYGGSVENRARFLLEVAGAVCGEVGSERVGVRLSPWADVNDCRDSNPQELHSYVVPALSKLGIAYLHLVEPRTGGERKFDPNHQKAPSIAKLFRPFFSGPMIAAGGYVFDSAETAIKSGECDAVAFGRLFIANPDLPKRFATHASLNPYDRSTFYGGAERGYTDYPFLEAGARPQ